MKTRTSHLLAALLLAGAVPLSHAQSTAQAATVQPPANLVDEPVASVSKDEPTANAVAQALNADASMKHSKMTVQFDDGNILLTGSTLTEAQRVQASNLAGAHVGEGKVINTLITDEHVVRVPVAAQTVAQEQPAEAQVAEAPAADVPAAGAQTEKVTPANPT